MSRLASFKLVALSLALSACVTINVYFPAAAAEKAADKIIEDVWGSEPAAKRVAFAGSLVVIAAGAYWFIQRVFFPS